MKELIKFSAISLLGVTLNCFAQVGGCRQQSTLAAQDPQNSKLREFVPRYLEAIAACEGKDNSWKSGLVSSDDFGPYFKGASIDCDSEKKNIASFIEALVMFNRSDKKFDEILSSQYQLTQADILGIKAAYKIALDYNEENINQPWVIVNNKRIQLTKLKQQPATEAQEIEIKKIETEISELEEKINLAREEHKKLFAKAKATQGELSRVYKGDGYITPASENSVKTQELGTVLKRQLNHVKVCWDELKKRETPQECPEVSDVVIPRLDCGAPQNPKGFKSIQQLWNISRDTKMSCNDKAAAVKLVFQKFKSSSPDDVVAMKLVASNLSLYLQNPTRLQILGGMLEAAEPVPLGAAEDVAPTFSKNDLMHYSTTVLNARLALIGELKKAENVALATGDGARRYNEKICELAERMEDAPAIKLLTSVFDKLSEDSGFCSTEVSADKREEIINSAVKHMEEILSDPKRVTSRAKEFAAYCDHKVARIFGNENSVASVCGHDHVKPTSTVSLSVAEKESLSIGQERAHVFMNMHIYPNKQGGGQSEFFAPLGATSSSAGSLAASQGSYNLVYPKLGRYRNVILNINHLGTPSMLGNYRKPQLARSNGTVPVGTIGGVGGDTEGYRHSHVQILVGGNKRLNFVDAFCRD